MNKFFNFLTLGIMAIGTTAITSCKKTFDNPPANVDPALTVTTTIAALKAPHVAGKFDAITTDIIISGIVVANDKSGNLYKEIFIQDETGGIALLMEGTSLFNQFPVGRKVYVKCNGLYLSDYAKLAQLGAIDRSIPGNPSLTGIPSTLFSKYVIGGSINHPVVPTKVSPSDLTTNMLDPLLGTLIQMDNFEIGVGDTSRTWADTSAAKQSVDIGIKDCSGSSLIIRSSGYSNFAGQKVPRGNGPVTAIYTIYNSTKQLIIRDPSDAPFTQARCAIFEQDMGALTSADNNAIFALPGWQNISETGTVKFKYTVFGATGKAILVNAFASASPVVKSWLITPPISLAGTTTPKLVFNTAYRFATGPSTLKAYISTDYTGGANPSASTWTLLPANIPANTATNNSSTWTSYASSGNLDLSAYAGQNVYIAFVYEAGDPGKTTAIELDDIKILKQ